MSTPELFGTAIQSYINCGYVTEEALDEVGRLSEFERNALAAMALTHRDSCFSDRQQDLDRGTVLLLEKAPYWWTV